MYFGFSRLCVQYGKHTVLNHLDFSLERGKITALLGPNGSGKSTLFRAISGTVSYRGEIVWEGRELSSYARKERAKRIAYLPQQCRLPEDIDVETFVSYGRYPHRKPFCGFSASDRAAVEEAVCFADLQSLRHRELVTLSGGERQRARIAMALAQQPELLLMDEPITFLDVRYQTEFLRLAERLNREKGITVLMALHDFNLAVRYADLLCVLNGGKICRSGIPEDVVNQELLNGVFGLDESAYRAECLPFLVPGEKE